VLHVPPKYPTKTESRIRRRRDELDVSADDLARVTGVSKRTISRAENGEPPTLRALVNIAIALEVDPLDLLQPEWLERWTPMHDWTAPEPPKRGWWRKPYYELPERERPPRKRRSRRKISDWMGHTGGGTRQTPRHPTE
jgi:transcriptional regulator with XRE-family HTH domain